MSSKTQPSSVAVNAALRQVYPLQPHRYSMQHVLKSLAAACDRTTGLTPEEEHLIEEIATCATMVRTSMY
jgi:hypothetical protein